MKRSIKISGSFEEEKRKEQDLYLKMSDEERFFLTCELSEIMLQIQYENGVLPKETNFTLTR